MSASRPLKKMAKKTHIKKEAYDRFDKINGEHLLKKKVSDAVVEYRVRKRKGGKLAFFNFDLAKEMGLIRDDHPDKISKTLENKILETFSLVIINEYDQINGTKFPPKEIKDNTYMATRYLQLQHPCKKGETSGDGRSIWNGQLTHKGMTWDISS